MNIPPRFFAEATLVVSLLLLLSVYITDFYLDQFFSNSAEVRYEDGSLSAAELDYLKAIEIEPGKTEYSRGLGQVYESLGWLDKATEQYFKSVEGGSSVSLNNLGRTFINRPNPITRKSDPALAEAYLLLGLQRMQTRIEEIDNPDTLHIIYQLNRNIGWALINQEKYEAAEPYLQTAIQLEESITDPAYNGRAGNGMAYCFLAQAYEMLENPDAARLQWQQCRDQALPEYVHEYKWFLDVGQDDLAYCIDTRHITTGYIAERVSANGVSITEWCQALYAPAETQ